MNRRSSKFLVLAGFAAAALCAPLGVVRAQTAPAVHLIPQSLQNEHAEDLEKLDMIAKRPGKVGEIAGKAIALLVPGLAGRAVPPGELINMPR